MQTDRIIRKLNRLSPDVGAVVTFTGVVRSEGGRLWGLEYEVYERMLVPVIDQLKREAIANFHLFGAEIVRKKGRQPAGAPVFLVATAARHRREAFEATVWLVEEFKKKAPVWKTEIPNKGARKA